MTLTDLFQKAGISIRLGQGVVGKTTTAVVVALIGIAIVGRNLSNEWLAGGCALAIGIIFIVYFVGILWFATKNPAAALLEGARLLKWQETEWIAKGMLSPPSTPRMSDPKGPRSLSPPENAE